MKLLFWVSNWESINPSGPVVRAQSSLFPMFNGMHRAGFVRMTPRTKGSAIATLTDAGRAAIAAKEASRD